MAKLKVNQKIQNLSPGSISTILGKETEFNGILTFKKSLQVNGYFHGEIESEGFLVIAPGANVEANLKAREIIIGGKVKGNVEGTKKVELLDSAELYGNIKTVTLHIDEGAVFQGNCDRLEEIKKKK